MLHGRDRTGQAASPRPWEVALIALASSAAFAITIELVCGRGGYWDYAASAGDNFDYLRIMAAIRRSDVASFGAVLHLWGAPYLAAAVAWGSGLSDVAAWVALSLLASVATVVLAARLWGSSVAAVFAIASWDWLQAATLGGSEPPFLLLAFGAFAAARSACWTLAALCAAASATVRPVGVFVVAAIVLVLAARREFARAALAVVTTAVVLGAYAGALARLPGGGVLAHWRGYECCWIGGWPLALPFQALLAGMMQSATAFALARSAAWVAITILGLATMWARAGATGLSRYDVERAFVVLLVLFLFTYSSVPHAWVQFPRHVLPLVPFVLAALVPWLPRDRRLLWTLSPVSGALAAGWVIGFHRAWHLLRG